jgi:beta-N-acetylhexosaminidase
MARHSHTLKIIMKLGAFTLASLLLAGCASADSSSDTSEGAISQRSRVDALMAKMSLEERVGQLFVTYAYGDDAETATAADVSQNRSLYGVDNGKALLDKYHLGGIIYFTWANNLKAPEQIARLSNGLQRASKVPLLISTDQEMGLVVRVGPPATQFPGSMAVGASRNGDDACTAAAITGQELRVLGITQNFAPVADVNVNPQNPVIGIRSFGEDPTLVAQMIGRQVTCMQSREGVAATAKHFPGHGDTNVDSHTGIPLIGHSVAEWQTIDAPPFQSAIAAGIDSIMTAHIVVPALDPSGDPATLSRPILTGILREQLGYRGVVITDSLGMAGVRQKYGDDRIPVLALKAGVDQLLMPAKLDVAYQAVLGAVRNGELTEARIDESVRRVLELKERRGLLENATVDEAVSGKIGTPEHLAAAQALADHTITLVKNEDELLPWTKDSGKSVFVTGWGDTTTVTIAKKIRDRGLSADAMSTGTSPAQAQIDAAVAAAATHDFVVVTTNGVGSADAPQSLLVKALVATGKPVVTVAARAPYDVANLPATPAHLLTYGTADVSLESLVRVLFAEVAPSGKLPVTVPAGATQSSPLAFGYGLTYSR